MDFLWGRRGAGWGNEQPDSRQQVTSDFPENCGIIFGIARQVSRLFVFVYAHVPSVTEIYHRVAPPAIFSHSDSFIPLHAPCFYPIFSHGFPVSLLLARFPLRPGIARRLAILVLLFIHNRRRILMVSWGERVKFSGIHATRISIRSVVIFRMFIEGGL